MTPSRAILLALALLLLGATPARAARGMEMAIEDEDAFVDQRYGPREAVLSAAQALGVTRMRILGAVPAGAAPREAVPAVAARPAEAPAVESAPRSNSSRSPVRSDLRAG